MSSGMLLVQQRDSADCLLDPCQAEYMDANKIGRHWYPIFREARLVQLQAFVALRHYVKGSPVLKGWQLRRTGGLYQHTVFSLQVMTCSTPCQTGQLTG